MRLDVSTFTCKALERFCWCTARKRQRTSPKCAAEAILHTTPLLPASAQVAAPHSPETHVSGLASHHFRTARWRWRILSAVESSASNSTSTAQTAFSERLRLQ